jgi:5-methyltetrahydropteroyltriglutamate--homocysteine methyltransferase
LIDLPYFQDCGLKTRGWKETEASLKNLVSAARWARQQYV